MTRNIDLPPRPPYFATHCEMQDVATRAGVTDAINAPGAASIELAKLLTEFEPFIDDEWRARLIHLGGICIRLATELEKEPANG